MIINQNQSPYCWDLVDVYSVSGTKVLLLFDYVQNRYLRLCQLQCLPLLSILDADEDFFCFKLLFSRPLLFRRSYKATLDFLHRLLLTNFL